MLDNKHILLVLVLVILGDSQYCMGM